MRKKANKMSPSCNRNFLLINAFENKVSTKDDFHDPSFKNIIFSLNFLIG